MIRQTIPALFALALAACSQEQPTEETPTAAPAPEATVAGRAFEYTSLKDCPVLESNAEEAGYFLSECLGKAGYKLRVIESDLRQTVEVVSPGGQATALDLAAVTGGGFSRLGDTVEWRGVTRDGALVPDALILRHAVVTDPEGKNEVSYLVAVKLTETPCAIAKIPPGPGQNEKARAAADEGGDCLTNPN